MKSVPKANMKSAKILRSQFGLFSPIQANVKINGLVIDTLKLSFPKRSQSIISDPTSTGLLGFKDCAFSSWIAYWHTLLHIWILFSIFNPKILD